VFDIWKAAAPTIPTVANTITAAAKPTLTSQQTNASTTLTGWTTAVAANDMLGFNVDSATTVSWAVLQLFVTKS
jgi:Tfp pilus assembly protein PilV